MLVEFETLKLSWKPNQYLMAPANVCRNAKPHMENPVFDVPVQTLHDAFLAVVRRQPRTELVEEGPDGERFVQRSRVFRFPDTVDVKFLAIGDNQSTMGIYSRAKYGLRDFGVNEARVRIWMKELESELKSA